MQGRHPILSQAQSLLGRRRLAEARSLLGGLAVQALGQDDAAVFHFQQALLAIEHEPHDLEAALDHLRRADALSPDHAAIASNQGVVLRRLGRYDEAERAYLEAIRRQPDLPDAHRNLGFLYRRRGALDQAQQAYRRALALRPDDTLTRYNHALALLMAGQDDQGWEAFECRLRFPGLAQRTPRFPSWQGGAVAGKRLMVWAEQGFGDIVQFARFIPALQAAGADVVVEARDPVAALLRTNLGVRVVPPGAPSLPHCDGEVPLLSLPHRMRLAGDRFGHVVPYVAASENERKPWEGLRNALFSKGGDKPVVALVWRGSPTNERDAERSLAASAYLPLLKVPGIHFVSLQLGDAEGTRLLCDHGVTDWASGRLRDFSDVAAALSVVDLLVSVDTAYLHVAGASGVPVWGLLPYMHEWRWGRAGDTSDWYPTLRLWRGVLGDFEDHTIGNVRSALEALVKQSDVWPSRLTLGMRARARRASMEQAEAAFQVGNLEAAEWSALSVLRSHRDDVNAMNRLAAIAWQRGRFLEAANWFGQVVQKRPQDHQAWHNLASAADKAGNAAQAEAAYREALHIKPDSHETLLQLSAFLREHDRLEHAEQCLMALQNAGVESAEVQYHFGSLCQRRGQLQLAAGHFERALALDPDHAEVHVNLGMLQLAQRAFPEGWRNYEWRWRVPRMAAVVPRLPGVPWQGETLGSRHLMVGWEQGFGDTLMFSRYVAALRRREPRARISLRCQRPLYRLLQPFAQQWDIGLIDAPSIHAGPTETADFHALTMSLPALLNDSVHPYGPPEQASGYLRADPAWCAQWVEPLRQMPQHHVKVGLCWRGSRQMYAAPRRNLTLHELQVLCDVPRVSWFSLQLDADGAEWQDTAWQGRLHDWTGRFTDFADTAGLIAALDLVITVDTAVCHLAAAMGKPVFLLNRFDSCWRWFDGRHPSPWYVGLQEFRQSSPGEWGDAMAAARSALIRLSKAA